MTDLISVDQINEKKEIGEMSIHNVAFATVIVCWGALWASYWWRLRGGAWTALTGLDPGTGGMRAFAAAGLSLPLLGLGGWIWVLLMPALWLGWSLAGWGAFQGMGKSAVTGKNPLERLLARFLSPVPMCLVGMALEGAYTMILPGAVSGWIAASWQVGMLVMLWGVGFSPIYWFAQHLRRVPDLGQFEHGNSEVAECLVGLWVGIILTAIPLALRVSP